MFKIKIKINSRRCKHCGKNGGKIGVKNMLQNKLKHNAVLQKK